MKATDCPNCGKKLDAATCVTDDGARPSPDDLTICFYCGHLMAFADDLSFRKLTDDEMHEIAGDPVILRIQRHRAKAQP
jgi:hypothetical protein